MLHQKTIKRLEITSIITILAFIGYFFGDKVTFFDEKLTGSVYKIYDGDTITLHRDNKDYKIRFFGIDAPELKQEFGKESREHLLELCPIGSEATVSIKDKDKYGRIVGIIECKGYNLNKEQVAQGYAWAYTDYSFLYFPNQFNSKTKKLGLWQQDNAIEPKLWRQMQKNKK
ncbi:TPA: thermonuclease family protein [Campylobacter coli]|nr:thermonuclease family protein [Campylobacter coli]